MSRTTRGREVFAQYKKILVKVTMLLKLTPLGFRVFLFEHTRYIYGKKGIAIRYVLLRSICEKCGDNVSVHQGVYILKPQNIQFGDNISIHPMCYLDATGDIEFGNDISVAHNVTILSSEHNFSSFAKPIKDQGVTTSRTKISNDVWIGAKSTILAGVTINSGCILAANCVVTKDTEMNQVLGGVPARLIKTRG